MIIGGQAIGSFEAGGHFAIEAQQIGSLQIGKTSFALNPTADDFLIGSTNDFRLHEVA